MINKMPLQNCLMLETIICTLQNCLESELEFIWTVPFRSEFILNMRREINSHKSYELLKAIYYLCAKLESSC